MQILGQKQNKWSGKKLLWNIVWSWNIYYVKEKMLPIYGEDEKQRIRENESVNINIHIYIYEKLEIPEKEGFEMRKFAYI